ncbi:serine protease [Lentzea sp. NBRC 105346]|uniref:S8 family peptidase n=1 Tax=Lentzea sp. NBRC 105346 TaxID=3032205 RepID=UPI00249FBEB5|nr:S8 family serine peptidase [Lentzea sp. NBRC 105346]GLZ28292.1 serine protease [Lentzea sp. NBRC 105346]
MKRLSWLAAIVTAAATLSVPAQAAPAPPGAGVTLLTGDHVTIEGDRARVRPARGREHIAFRQYQDEHGDLHVVPADVQQRISTGRLDPRLFDITELVRSGYDDASSPVTPLIVQGGINAQGATLASIGAVAVAAPKGQPFLQTMSDQKVWLDGKVSASLDKSVPQIGAPQAWQAGFTGKNATVAVLDTGVDATHPDLADAVSESKDFTESPSGTDDRVGHGTHVASTITGEGTYRGVAPDAKLAIGKVLNDFGGGRESWIIAGMEWAAARADVVNMSLGSPWPSEGDDPMSLALNKLTEQTGALFVVAAGNSGPSDESIGSPAAADEALTVGAVDRQDNLADFSSRGPRWNNGAIKPDITAPGVGIVAARAKNGQFGKPGDTHVALSGTSMATPHVAGAAAILAGQHPDWTAPQLKAALMSTAKPNAELTVYQQGAGRVDVAKAVTTTVTASEASLNLGTALWPHNDDKPMVRTVTYRNSGTAPVTLDLSIAMKPAPLATVSPAKLVVPAGGTADATVTVNTAVDAPDALYGGVLDASGLRIPIGFTKEVESYDVAMSFVDHAGAPTGNYFYRFVSHDRPKAFLRYDASGTLVQRLPKGKYYYETYIQNPGFTLLTQVVEPAFEITGATTLVNDARSGEQPGFKVDKPNAKVGQADLQFRMKLPWGDTGLGMYLGSFDSFRVTPAKTSYQDFQYGQSATLGEPDGNGGFTGSPYLYHLTYTHEGTVPKGLVREVHDRSLAVVRSVAHTHRAESVGERDGVARGKLPLHLTEYYTPDTPWTGSLTELDGDQPFPPAATQLSTARKFTGRSTERWNVAVFGPAFPEFPAYPGRWAYRSGDQVSINVPMFSDQDPRHYGGSKVDSARTVLSRDGKVVAETPYQGSVYGPVPESPGTYQLHAEAGRETVSTLSTRISADWTFTSSRPAGTERVALPLLAVRFAPNLDESNRTAAGRGFAFPVYVQRNGSTATDVKTPAVQVSYDDGATWQPVRLVRIGGKWIAAVAHPKDAKFVSLKASAHDSAGNSVDQTIIRAYGLK